MMNGRRLQMIAAVQRCGTMVFAAQALIAMQCARAVMRPQRTASWSLSLAFASASDDAELLSHAKALFVLH